MFLQALLRKNPAFVEAVVALHQTGAIPANSYAVDLDAVTANTSHLMDEARAFGVDGVRHDQAGRQSTGSA